FDENYTLFMKMCSTEYENTFVVAGNHEYWNRAGIELTNEKIEDVTSKLGNVHFINNKVLELDNLYILGCTLWSHINTISNKLIGDDINIHINDIGGKITRQKLLDLHI